MPIAGIAEQVTEAMRIEIPGLTATPVLVEMVRRIEQDPDDRDLDTIELTVWPVLTDEYPEPGSHEQWNYGHFYAKFMVTLNLTTSHPVRMWTLDEEPPTGEPHVDPNDTPAGAAGI